jgi:C1A family cysteine protease
MFSVSKAQSIIKNVDMRHLCPAVYDQGNLSSCTANALAAAYQFDEMKEHEKTIFTPSRLFIYYNERKLENSVNSDDGARIQDGVTVLNKIGVCPETMWKYDETKVFTAPPKECYDTAKKHKSVGYKRVSQTLPQLKQCLIEGYPFIFGMTVYESFEGEKIAKDGILNMPAPNEAIVGGHAILCVGFNDDTKCFIVRNSWGASWGDKGYFYMPYVYMTNPNLTEDFWTIHTVLDK